MVSCASGTVWMAIDGIIHHSVIISALPELRASTIETYSQTEKLAKKEERWIEFVGSVAIFVRPMCWVWTRARINLEAEFRRQWTFMVNVA